MDRITGTVKKAAGTVMGDERMKAEGDAQAAKGQNVSGQYSEQVPQTQASSGPQAANNQSVDPSQQGHTCNQSCGTNCAGRNQNQSSWGM